jgi:rod shape-determining protein MreD
VKILAPLLGVVIYLALQAAVASRIAIGSIAPDFVVVCVVLFALQRGSLQGAVFGFAVGFLVDLSNPGYLGLNALTKTLLGFAAGGLGAATSPGVLVLAVVFFAAALAHDILYLLIYLWPGVGGALLTVVTNALPSAIYTALAGITVERVLALLGAKVVTSFGKERQY